MKNKKTKNIDDVKKFWNNNPLWTGESKFESGTVEFFEEHRKVYINDCFGGTFDIRFLPPPRLGGQKIKILDLGCGIGFWSTEFGMRGYCNITSADLTKNAILITEKRLKIYDLKANLFIENAESMNFKDNFFDHINCQGVIHHTPNTKKSIEEIARVLKKDGTASISVYYKNFALRLWPILKFFVYPLALIGGGLKGRGRENIFKLSKIDDIVKLYDGDENPIGKSYSKREIINLLKLDFDVNEVYYHFFPARSLPFKIPKKIHKWLDSNFPFMIYLNLKKKCVE